MWGHSPAGLFGYSQVLGGYAGGQAEYLRVPYADVGPIKISNGLSDEQALFLSDIFPTGYIGRPLRTLSRRGSLDATTLCFLGVGTTFASPSDNFKLRHYRCSRDISRPNGACRCTDAALARLSPLYSRRTSRAGLSSRRPTKTVCRSKPSSDHVK